MKMLLAFILSISSAQAATKAIRIGGKCLDVPNGQMVNGAKIQLWDCNNSKAQALKLSTRRRLHLLSRLRPQRKVRPVKGLGLGLLESSTTLVRRWFTKTSCSPWQMQTPVMIPSLAIGFGRLAINVMLSL